MRSPEFQYFHSRITVFFKDASEHTFNGATGNIRLPAGIIKGKAVFDLTVAVNAIIRNINETIVAPNERLANHCYIVERFDDGSGYTFYSEEGR